MPIQEIPYLEWRTFCESFSRQHVGWLVSLEVLSADLGVMASYLAFEEINVDKRDGGEDIISIVVGKTEDNRLTEIIVAPSQIKLEQTAEGAHQALHIQSTSGATTVLRFRTTVLPELINGVVL